MTKMMTDDEMRGVVREWINDMAYAEDGEDILPTFVRLTMDDLDDTDYHPFIAIYNLGWMVGRRNGEINGV